MEKLWKLVKYMKRSLELDRYLCEAINVYLRIRGFPSNTLHQRLIKPIIHSTEGKNEEGVPMKGDNNMPSMNLREWLSLMNPRLTNTHIS